MLVYRGRADTSGKVTIIKWEEEVGLSAMIGHGRGDGVFERPLTLVNWGRILGDGGIGVVGVLMRDCLCIKNYCHYLVF